MSNQRLALITGASSGIGQSCAELFAKNGMRLILCARRKERLSELASHLQQTYQTSVHILQLDVSDKEEVIKQLNHLPAEWKAIDILVNNAGLALDSLPIQQGDMDHWDTMIDTNIRGLLYMTRLILPGMIERARGHIVNIGSVAGHETYPLGNVYCATKHAVKAISSCMRLDLLGTPIKVSEISPGAVHTEFSEVRWQDKEKAEKFYQSFKALTPVDVAETILFCVTRPSHMNVAEMLIFPADQASANHLLRK